MPKRKLVTARERMTLLSLLMASVSIDADVGSGHESRPLANPKNRAACVRRS